MFFASAASVQWTIGCFTILPHTLPPQGILLSSKPNAQPLRRHAYVAKGTNYRFQHNAAGRCCSIHI